MLAGLILFAAENLAVYSYHSPTVVSFYEPAAVKEVMTTIWVNISGPISSRLTNMAFNFVRFLVIILLYLFATYLKQPPRLPDDYLFGLGFFGSVLGGEQGVAMGAITLMRRIDEDTAFYSEVIHIAILIVVLAGLIALLRVLFDPNALCGAGLMFRSTNRFAPLFSECSDQSFGIEQHSVVSDLDREILGFCLCHSVSDCAVELASIVTKLRLNQHRNALAFFLTIFTVAILPASRCPVLFLHC